MAEGFNRIERIPLDLLKRTRSILLKPSAKNFVQS